MTAQALTRDVSARPEWVAVLGHAAPADESDPPARPQRTPHMGKRPSRIVEEHHPETREQDVERSLGQLGAAGVGHPEQDRRILWCKRTRSADQRFGYVHA